MKTTTNVKSGGFRMNHNQSTVGVKIATSVKSGGVSLQHNQSIACV